MEIFLILIVIGAIPAMIAASKGRNFFLWWLYGVGLFIIALVHSLLLKSKRACPYCAEDIKEQAKICPHCRHDLAATGNSAQPVQAGGAASAGPTLS
jgi:hypothetical protein